MGVPGHHLSRAVSELAEVVELIPEIRYAVYESSAGIYASICLDIFSVLYCPPKGGKETTVRIYAAPSG